MFSLQSVRVFVAVCETGGIRGAAERLARTASAVSMSLKQLEDDIGAPLFEGERKSRLTPLGQLVLDEGRDLLAHYERARSIIRATAAKAQTRAEIACVPSVAATFLPEIVSRLAALDPPVQLRARDMDSRSVREAVAAGAVDVGVASFTERKPGLSFDPLYADRLSLLCRRDSPLASRRSALRWADLAGQRFLGHGGYGMIRDPAFFRLVDSACVQLPNVMSLLALVRAGEGVTILPGSFESHGDPSIRFMRLEDPDARQIIGVITRSDHRPSPATQAFLAVLRERVRARIRRRGSIERASVSGDP